MAASDWQPETASHKSYNPDTMVEPRLSDADDSRCGNAQRILPPRNG